jgi:Flp pilus assembly protein TadG
LFSRDDSGATAVEFAMVSVPFLGLLFAIFQTAYLFLVQQAVDAAATTGARNILTGQTMSANITSASTFASKVICPNLPAFLSCSSLIIDVRSASSSSWSSLNTASDFLNSSSNKFCIGNPNDIVIVRIIYPVPAFLSIMTLSASLGGAGKMTAGQSLQTSTNNMVYPIMGISAFKNEPFTSTTYNFPTGC